MRCGRTYRWTRMHRHRALFRELGTFFAVRSWAGCITNMFGFDLRQAQALTPESGAAIFRCEDRRCPDSRRATHIRPHHQCAFSTASTDVTPAIIEAVIAISAGTPRGNSRLISEAMK